MNYNVVSQFIWYDDNVCSELVGAKYYYGYNDLIRSSQKIIRSDRNTIYPIYHITGNTDVTMIAKCDSKGKGDTGTTTIPLFDSDVEDLEKYTINIQDIWVDDLLLSTIINSLKLKDIKKEVVITMDNKSLISCVVIDIPDYKSLYPHIKLQFDYNMNKIENSYKEKLKDILKNTSMEYIENIIKDIKEEKE